MAMHMFSGLDRTIILLITEVMKIHSLRQMSYVELFITMTSRSSCVYFLVKFRVFFDYNFEFFAK